MDEIVKDRFVTWMSLRHRLRSNMQVLLMPFVRPNAKERFLAKSAAAFCYQRRLMRYRLYACGGVLMGASFIVSSIFDTGRANRKRCSDVR